MNGGRLAQILVQLGFVALVLLAWYLATTSGAVSPLLLPRIDGVARDFWAIVLGGQFWPDLRLTMFELVVAYALAAGLGLLVGYLVSRTRYGVRVFDPLLSSFYAVPMVLLFPLFVLFFGLGPGSKIAIGTTIAFFPITLNTIAGLSRVDRGLITASQSMGASSSQLFWHVMLPGAAPVVLTGLRIGLIVAFLSILGTETIASIAGLGHQIAYLADMMETSRMFAYVVFVLIIAIALNIVVTTVETRARRRLV